MAVGDTERSAWIDILKCIGVILITNSHFDLVYPNDSFAAGGQLGNAIFFFTTGYTTAGSLQRRPRSFAPWYADRLRSLYIPTWIALLFTVILSLDEPHSYLSIVYNIIIPLEFWFIPAISVLYCVAFAVSKLSAAATLATALLLISAYVVIGLVHPENVRPWIENDIWVKSIGYGGCMFLGATYARLPSTPVAPRWVLALIAAASLVAYVALMLLMRLNASYTGQFAGMLLAILFTLFLSASLAGVRLHGVAERIVGLVSPLTLFIYLVQVPILHHLPWQYAPFPLRAALAVVAIGMSAVALKYLSKHLLSLFQPRQSATNS